MSAADLAKQFGGAPLADSLSKPSSTAVLPAQNAQAPQTPSSLASSMGGQELNSQDSGFSLGGAAKAVGNFFTGNTQQFGQTAGQAFAAPGNADKYAESMQSFNDVNNNLLKAIKAKQASGGDVTKLQEALHEHMQSAPNLRDFTGNVIDTTGEQIAGQALGTGLEALSGGTIGGLEAANGASSAAKIGKAALTGAGYGAAGGVSNAMKENQSAGDVAASGVTGAAIGGATGGAVAGAGQLLDKALSTLPNRLVRNAIPALDEKGAQYALDTKPIGTVEKLFKDSVGAVKSLGSQIDSIISHPQYADIKIGLPGTVPVDGKMVSSNGIIQGTLDSFPDSNYSEKDITKAIKGLVPEKAKLVDKIISGEATLEEANDLKKAIYPKVQKVFTDSSNPAVSAQKMIGANFSTAIADTIKSFVPETVPVFDNLSKEINFRNALLKTYKKQDAQKLIGLYDLGTLAAGSSIAGIPGAVAGEVISKVAKSPTAKFALAKTLNAIGKAPGIPSAINKLNTKI